MDSKVTLSFNSDVIERAKKYAADNNMSLSRLTEYLLNKAISNPHRALEDFPVADWVMQVAEGPIEYHTTKRGRKSAKNEFFEAKK